MVVTVFDTITITKTITVVLRQAQEPNEPDDTVRVSTVTERDHVRDRSQLKVKSEKLKVETDTVYVERDSLRLTAYSLPDVTQKSRKSQKLKPSGFVSALRWVFWILVAVIAIIILMRIKLRR